VRIKDPNTICCFRYDNTIIIVGINGIYYKAKIPIEKGGDCQIIQEQKFWKNIFTSLKFFCELL